MNQWYIQLKKPLWSPPSKILGPVWSILSRHIDHFDIALIA